MAGWQRHLQSLVRQVAKRYECSQRASFSTFNHTKASWCLEFTSSRSLLADASEGTVSSPLIPALPSSTGTTETQKAISKPSKVQAILKKIKMSPKKLNLVAEFVRGMRVEDALLQLQVTVKRAAKTVYQVIHSARANATHNYGFDPDRLLVAEAFVGKGRFLKRASYHGRGKCGIRVKPECRLTVVLREITSEEEAKIAKLKVHNYRKASKKKNDLCLTNLSRALQFGIGKANLEVKNQVQWLHEHCNSISSHVSTKLCGEAKDLDKQHVDVLSPCCYFVALLSISRKQ